MDLDIYCIHFKKRNITNTLEAPMGLFSHISFNPLHNILNFILNTSLFFTSSIDIFRCIPKVTG